MFDALTSVAVREGEQGETEGRRMVRYPDTQQLFVGNVPHDVDKMELKEFFERKAVFFVLSLCFNRPSLLFPVYVQLRKSNRGRASSSPTLGGDMSLFVPLTSG